MKKKKNKLIYLIAGEPSGDLHGSHLIKEIKKQSANEVFKFRGLGGPLMEKEGLFLGTSSGINVAGAINLAKDLGPGKTIVTILCDKSDRYHSKIFNKKFLLEKKLPTPNWL